ncbi:OB-fold domain-containing protein [Pseudonocardia ailaonensis]|uniref:OB-fold domain-containing protein n=1 Tax=Pseudonocardia ailaonensis TaxID=367279 RepID=A0ABN2N2K0_9PSEU
MAASDPRSPTPTAALAPYTEGLAAGELRTTRCSACGTVQFPPRTACPHCSRIGTGEWVTASGRGTVWSFCVFHKAYLPPPAPQPPYTVAVVRLDEGSKLVTTVIDTDDLRIGMAVEAVFSDDDGEPRVRFRPAPAGREHPPTS